MNPIRRLLFLAIGLSLLMPPGAANAERKKGYFEQSSGAASVRPKQEGYFFYTTPPEEQKPDETVPEKQLHVANPDTPQPKEEKTPYNGIVPWDRVKIMHPDEFQTLMTDSLNYALIDPDDEGRMRDYMTLQMVAIDRSENFQQNWGRVLTKYPALDPTATRPPTGVATQVISATDNEEKKAAIDAMRENMGVLVFTRPGCPYCEQQREIMKIFQTNWGWENFAEIDITQNPEMGAEYGVDIVPDIYLVANFNGEIASRRLTTGLTTVSTLEKALLHAYYNWYKGKDYKTPMLEQGDAAFAAHLKRVEQEQKAALEQPQKPVLDVESFKRRVRQQR